MPLGCVFLPVFVAKGVLCVSREKHRQRCNKVHKIFNSSMVPVFNQDLREVPQLLCQVTNLTRHCVLQSPLHSHKNPQTVSALVLLMGRKCLQCQVGLKCYFPVGEIIKHSVQFQFLCARRQHIGLVEVCLETSVIITLLN